jgi:PAS domain S-box-containing protein
MKWWVDAPYVGSTTRKRTTPYEHSCVVNRSGIDTVRVRKNGSEAAVSLAASAIRGDAGEIVGVIIVLQDISDRKAAREALERSEARHRAIFESLTDVYFETSLDGTILEISPSAHKLLGFAPAQLLGASVAQLYRDPGTRKLLIGAILSQGEITDYEIRRLSRWHYVPVAVNARLTRRSGTPSTLQGIIHDITLRNLDRNARVVIGSRR